ncbi:flagellar motor switch protein FliN [Chrysiogenes arsenatis]|uniref:flagellar motor switch protein FliN n=1 Tax=Chrysiogenes arsenatis TaxID=309797 RepID=UPI0003FB870C|nr:flagellar motor switch protein FliN [Chrysiogenes arsenatis]
MTPEGLSQEEINAMLNMVGDSDSDTNYPLDELVGVIRDNFSASVGTSVNDSFSCDLVDNTTKPGDSIDTGEAVVLVTIPLDEGIDGVIFFAAPVSSASVLVDMMMMGAGESKETLEPEDVDAFNDLVNNSIASCSVPLSSKLSGKKIRFGATTASPMDVSGLQSALGDDTFACLQFSATIPDKVDSNFWIFIPATVAASFESLFGRGVGNGGDDFGMTDDMFDFGGDDFSSLTGGGDSVSPAASGGDGGHAATTHLDKDQLRNIEMLLDVDLSVIIRIGSTQIYMKDLLKLGSGSIVELDKKASDPVELVVNNKVIARGEVVVIDANFGLRINEILSKKERLNTLRG